MRPRPPRATSATRSRTDRERAHMTHQRHRSKATEGGRRPPTEGDQIQTNQIRTRWARWARIWPGQLAAERQPRPMFGGRGKGGEEGKRRTGPASTEPWAAAAHLTGQRREVKVTWSQGGPTNNFIYKSPRSHKIRHNSKNKQICLNIQIHHHYIGIHCQIIHRI
jgi:hypothetical protein